MIILIFGISSWAAGLAYVQEHCVAGIALPPADANTSFSSVTSSELSLGAGEEAGVRHLMAAV